MAFSVNLGNILLLISLALAVLVFVASMLRERGNTSLTRYVSPSIRAIAFLLALDILYLTYLFTSSNFTYMYVWSYSSEGLPLMYKISGVWAAQEGTFLLWAVLIFLAMLWMNESLDLGRSLTNRALILTAMVGMFFLIMTLLVSPFRTIYEVYPDLPLSFVPEEGNGMNPLLQDPWMAAHPPFTFIGYAAVTVPFASALAYIWRRDSTQWISIARNWIRLSWLFLTLGIAVGGFWSYKVLGWGGFWAWDPVETSSLVPWFTLTALAHAAVRYTRKGESPMLTLSLSVVSFWLVTYATFITRSGMWESVHAFGETVSGPFLAMLLVNAIAVPTILGVDFAVRRRGEASREAKALAVSFVSAQFVVALVKAIALGEKSLPSLNEVLAILAFTGLLFIALRGRFSSAGGKLEAEPGEERRLYTPGNLHYGAILLLVILAFISFWGLTYPFLVQALAEQKLKVDVAFFNQWSFPFALLLLVVMGLCMGYGLVKRNRLLAGAMAIGLLGALSHYIGVTPNLFVNFLLPFAAYALAIAFYRAAKTGLSGARRDIKLKLVSRYTIHLGVTLIIIGSAVSTTMSSERDVTFRVTPSQGLIKEVKDVGKGYAVSVERVGVDQTTEGYPVGLVQVKVYKDGDYLGEGTAKVESNEKFGKVTRVYINRNWDYDIYVIFQGISGAHQQGGDIYIPLTVKLEPLINILWLGVLLLSLGILPSMLHSGFKSRRQKK